MNNNQQPNKKFFWTNIICSVAFVALSINIHRKDIVRSISLRPLPQFQEIKNAIDRVRYPSTPDDRSESEITRNQDNFISLLYRLLDKPPMSEQPEKTRSKSKDVRSNSKDFRSNSKIASTLLSWWVRIAAAGRSAGRPASNRAAAIRRGGETSARLAEAMDAQSESDQRSRLAPGHLSG